MQENKTPSKKEENIKWTGEKALEHPAAALSGLGIAGALAYYKETAVETPKENPYFVSQNKSRRRIKKSILYLYNFI